MKDSLKKPDIFILGEIVRKIDRTFSTDEISEIFSIDPKSIKAVLKDIHNK
jgi:hypothetical protein